MTVRSSGQADQDRWVFAYAGVWPDAVKSRQIGEADRHRFNRSVWHYVNFPTFLNARDQTQMVGGLTVNLETVPTGEDNFNWNIIQAFTQAWQANIQTGNSIIKILAQVTSEYSFP